MDRPIDDVRGPRRFRRLLPRSVRSATGLATALLVALVLAGALAAATLGMLRPTADGFVPTLDTPAVPVANWGEPWHPLAEPPIAAQRASLRGYLSILGIAAVVLLLVGITHGAVAVIGRLAARRGEQAVRAALGAPAPTFVREIAGEIWLIASFAVVLAAVAAAGAALALASNRPDQLFAIGWGRQLAAAAILAPAAIIALLAFLATRFAWRSRRLLRGLGAGERATEDPRAGGTRDALVVTAFAASLVLLAGTGMLVRGAMPLLEPARLGYDAGDTLGVQVLFPGAAFRSGEARGLAQSRLREAALALPGVEAAGLATPGAWLGLGTSQRVFVECGECVVGLMYRPIESPWSQVHAVGDGFFEALRMPLLEGRRSGPGEALVNEALGRHYFEDGDPLGRSAWAGTMSRPARTITGLIGDIHVRGLGTGTRPRPVLYLPAEAHPPFEAWMAIRLAPGAATRPEDVHAALAAAVPGIDLSAVAPLADWLADFAAPLRWFALILMILAAAALALATHGLHAVARASVLRRRREIGIRLALGASPSRITRHMLGHALRLAAFGCLFGIIGAVGLARTLQMHLPGVRLLEPAVLATLALTLFAATLAGAWGPARSAARTDPAESLRGE